MVALSRRAPGRLGVLRVKAWVAENRPTAQSFPAPAPSRVVAKRAYDKSSRAPASNHRRRPSPSGHLECRPSSESDLATSPDGNDLPRFLVLEPGDGECQARWLRDHRRALTKEKKEHAAQPLRPYPALTRIDEWAFFF